MDRLKWIKPMPPVLNCTFPFPDQTPPVQVAHPCVACPNVDRAVLDLHATMDREDPELVAALEGFAKWFFGAGATRGGIEECLRYAADLYTREDHTGTCIPKTVLFAYYKGMQFLPDGVPPLSESAQGALKGLAVRSWPDGVTRRGRTWGELFEEYGRGYE